jgi:hypothetical protein
MRIYFNKFKLRKKETVQYIFLFKLVAKDIEENAKPGGKITKDTKVK